MFQIMKKSGSKLMPVRGRPQKCRRPVYEKVAEVATLDEARDMIEENSDLSIQYDTKEIARENARRVSQ